MSSILNVFTSRWRRQKNNNNNNSNKKSISLGRKMKNISVWNWPICRWPIAPVSKTVCGDFSICDVNKWRKYTGRVGHMCRIECVHTLRGTMSSLLSASALSPIMSFLDHWSALYSDFSPMFYELESVVFLFTRGKSLVSVTISLSLSLNSDNGWRCKLKDSKKLIRRLSQTLFSN